MKSPKEKNPFKKSDSFKNAILNKDDDYKRLKNFMDNNIGKYFVKINEYFYLLNDCKIINSTMFD